MGKKKRANVRLQQGGRFAYVTVVHGHADNLERMAGQGQKCRQIPGMDMLYIIVLPL